MASLGNIKGHLDQPTLRDTEDWRGQVPSCRVSRDRTSIWGACLGIFLTVLLFDFVVETSLTHEKAWRHPRLPPISHTPNPICQEI